MRTLSVAINYKTACVIIVQALCVDQSREWVDGSWVMGQMGHENRMGHMGHGSLGVDP